MIFLAPLLVGRKAERVTPRVWLGAALIVAGAVLLFAMLLGLVLYTAAFVAEIVRAGILSVSRGQQEAARAIGQRTPKIILRYVLPNVTASIIVLGTLQVATVIIAEAALSFLGLGVQPPTITWGIMLADGRDHLATSWWLSTFPGIAIFLAVLGFNLLGDGLRDALDPKFKL